MGHRPFGMLMLSLICLFVLFASVTAQDTSDDFAFPVCTNQCFLPAFSRSDCALGDTSCLCGDDQFARDIAVCLLANCTSADTLQTAKAAAVLCHKPATSRARDVVHCTSATLAVAFVFVALRISGKALSHRVSIDDAVIILALFLSFVSTGFVVCMLGMGFGTHIWMLKSGQLLLNLRLFYASSCVYIVTLGLIKVSLVLFYMQIFAEFESFRIPAQVVLWGIIASTAGIFFLTVFACVPISAFWNQNLHGKCLDLERLAVANSIVAIVQDVIIFVLPIANIRKLQIELHRKIMVAIMFAVGGLGCIATVLRLHTLLIFGKSIDPVWDYAPISVWTTLELGSGFICACLPSIRILFTIYLPRTFIKRFLPYSSSRSFDAHPAVRPLPNQGRRKDIKSWGHIITVDEEDYTKEVWVGQDGCELPPYDKYGRSLFPHPGQPVFVADKAIWGDEKKVQAGRSSWLPQLDLGEDHWLRKKWWDEYLTEKMPRYA